MTSVALLLPLALMMGLIGLGAFFWALKKGQFEDLDGAAARILIDDIEDAPAGEGTIAQSAANQKNAG